MSRILLIDADSTIPNLALMKLSGYHKALGNKVEMIKLKMPYFPHIKKHKRRIYTSRYDRVYCSSIFVGNTQYIEQVGTTDIEFGGTGHDMTISLPQQVDQSRPDYSIYPDNKKVYGFLTRGCIRKCKFCFVPDKEGMIRKDSALRDILDVDFEYDSVEFMDNNILSHTDHVSMIKEIIERNIKCSFNQGLDIRLINATNSPLIERLKYSGAYKFAFDDLSMMRLVNRKLELMDWRKDWCFRFYMYYHPSMGLGNLTKRLKWARQNKILPYIMRDVECWETGYRDVLSDLIQWCNVPAYFASNTLEHCLTQYKRTEEQIKRSVFAYNNDVTPDDSITDCGIQCNLDF